MGKGYIHTFTSLTVESETPPRPHPAGGICGGTEEGEGAGRKGNHSERIATRKGTERNHLQERQDIGQEEENPETATAKERLEMDEAREEMGEVKR